MEAIRLYQGVHMLKYLCVFLVAGYLYGEIESPALRNYPPMNEIFHPVSTQNPKAQKSFNQGLTYIFAFNHDLAFRFFEEASNIDPNLAMAYWGMALALGQNMNSDVTPENELKAYTYVQKALELSPKASPNEQAYIRALATRYTNDKSADLVRLRFLYRDAMKRVAQMYPEDLDANTLYAESILDLDPWKYWTWNGKPKEGTMEAIAVLESVLNRNPLHIGANHYYIHAWEESPTPERALMSAYRLTTLFPKSGHLLHMPCHIFLLVGDYHQAIETSKKAIAEDRQYIAENGLNSGPYPLHYLSHNLYVFSRAYMLAEDSDEAIKASLDLTNFIKPHLSAMPNMAFYMIVPLEVYLYFHKWNDLLNYDLPNKDNAAVLAYWHYTRAIAFAHLGNPQASSQEYDLMLQAKERIPSNEIIAQNPSKKIIEIADLMFQAEMAGIHKDYKCQIELLKRAVAIQEQMDYDEPPAWFMPIRVQLGKAYLKQGQYCEAEIVFREALKRLDRNGRLLYGLSLSLKGQGREWDLYWVNREAANALQLMTQPLSLDNL